ncbi:MAG TPA: terminase family protein, partial [Terriglobales bacterium]|nr:terminase family protein [Terriglobales bacterium]
WWTGRRFTKPISGWAVGDSSKTVRDILQRILLGPIGEFGTGMIPQEALARTTVKPGVADCIESIFVRHVSGGTSELTLKSYDQGREAFQGTNKDLIWLDEECDREIYVECLLRTMNTNGLVMVTFTPLLGVTEIVKDFLASKTEDTGKFCVQATWDDVPHLSAEVKAQLLASIPPYQREARSKGVPQLGSGAIYQVPEADVLVTPFEIPPFYQRAYGLDIGWNRTAAVWGARDPATGVVYLYDEYYRGQAEPAVHASAIKFRGNWIPGVIDPAARGRQQADGQQLIELYRREGLDLEPAINAVESGLYQVWQMLSTGKLKVFSTLGNWLQEFRLYQRDKEGRVVKENDHLMDAMRYLIVSGLERAKAKPTKPEPRLVYLSAERDSQRWMQ